MTNNQEKEKILLGFSLLPNIGPARFKKIIEQLPNILDNWTFNQNHLINAGLSEKQAQEIIFRKTKIDLEKEYLKLKQENIEIISPFLNKEDFPKKIQEISGAPFILFIKGKKGIIHKKQLAIIGTRRPTIYGKQVTEKLAKQVTQAGITITSGMATGIDSIAHEIAIENNQPTIAVLGNGLSQKILSRSSSYNLSKKIISSGGVLISEYPPEFEATKFTFPLRNRIISGLSMGIIVIEAGEKSGSLITAKYALDQNREIFAVPGNIFSHQSIGTNHLIKEGAIPVTDINDILSAFGIFPKKENLEKIKNEITDPDEKIIYKIINHEPLPLDKIAKISKIDTKIISGKLSLMELKGFIKKIGGGFIRS